jgi:hypothetical protein
MNGSRHLAAIIGLPFAAFVFWRLMPSTFRDDFVDPLDIDRAFRAVSDRRDQAEAAGEVGLPGIAEHPGSGADHERQLFLDHVVTFEQRVGFGAVGVRIDMQMRMTVTPQEVLET